MAKSEWSADGTLIPDLEQHTEKKHEILKNYLRDWVITLCANHRMNEKTITILDCFCGGGVYRKSGALRKGSPFLIIDAIKEGLLEVQTNRGKPGFKLDYKVLLIEGNMDHFQCLQLQAKNLGYEEEMSTGRIETINSEFEFVFDHCIRTTTGRRGASFFFIDPFGYTQYTMDQINRILQIRQSEVLLTYMLESITRFLYSEDGKTRTIINQKLNAEGYYREQPASDVHWKGKEHYYHNETNRLFRDKTNTRFLYSFGLMANRNTVKYYLLHFSNNSTAALVLKHALWQHNNQQLEFRYDSGMEGFKYLARDDIENALELFDINESNRENCLTFLTKKYMDSEALFRSGLQLRQLHDMTANDNPADRDIINKWLIELRTEGSVKVVRDGKITYSKKIRVSDVIHRTPKQYLLFPDSPKQNPES